ncbi:MAG TPA: SIS domain-containing protein [Thermomicrobiales bacterium]|nr:SIS domain-containing protein [Thermomicrobiales bacterium]
MSSLTAGLADAREAVLAYRAGLQAVLAALPVDDVARLIAELEAAYDAGRQIFVAGNGGSAATAAHLACDLGKTTLGRAGGGPARRFRVIALTDNVPLLTAWGNDAGYAVVFAEQLRNLADPGDLLVVISASGNSPNILAALAAARELGLRAAGLLGFGGGAAAGLVDTAVVVPSADYGHVEDVHLVLTHLVTAHFRQALAAPQAVAVGIAS